MVATMFMQIEGIPGDAQAPQQFHDCIEVQGWDWEASVPAIAPSGSRAAAPRGANPQALSFIKLVDKATPKIYESLFKGARIPHCTLSCLKPGVNDLYLEIAMTDCLISNASTGCKPGENQLTENVTISFTGVRITEVSAGKAVKVELSFQPSPRA
jgi:type VI secretion system Hcp family effector